MKRDEMSIELGDSWFTTKTMEVESFKKNY